MNTLGIKGRAKKTKEENGKQKENWRDKQMRKKGRGRRGSHLQLITTSTAKTRLEKEEWTQCPDLGQEAQRQRCPSPKSFLAPPFPEKSGKEIQATLPLPSSICASPGFFLSLVILFSHFSLTPHYFLYLLFAFSPTPLSPPSSCLTLLNQQHVALMETRS